MYILMFHDLGWLGMALCSFELDHDFYVFAGMMFTSQEANRVYNLQCFDDVRNDPSVKQHICEAFLFCISQNKFVT